LDQPKTTKGRKRHAAAIAPVRRLNEPAIVDSRPWLPLRRYREVPTASPVVLSRIRAVALRAPSAPSVSPAAALSRGNTAPGAPALRAAIRAAVAEPVVVRFPAAALSAARSVAVGAGTRRAPVASSLAFRSRHWASAPPVAALPSLRTPARAAALSLAAASRSAVVFGLSFSGDDMTAACVALEVGLKFAVMVNLSNPTFISSTRERWKPPYHIPYIPYIPPMAVTAVLATYEP
jgi:hypothetical protein